MQSSLINIGNSKGVIIPDEFLEQCGIYNEIIIEVEHDTIVITPIGFEKRKGWAETFKAMAENEGDQ